MRGLKTDPPAPPTPTLKVAPLVGAWIEIFVSQKLSAKARVAPLVGAWIEILNSKRISEIFKVAPLVGAWIEILS